MTAVHRKYPDDVEAAAFTALALLGTAHDGRDFAIYMRSAAILEPLFPVEPEAPGHRALSDSLVRRSRSRAARTSRRARVFEDRAVSRTRAAHVLAYLRRDGHVGRCRRGERSGGQAHARAVAAMTMRRSIVVALAAAVVVVAMARPSGQSGAGASGYLTPPKAVLDILDAPPLPDVAVSPTRDVLALLPRRGMPSIGEVSEPMLRLAGLRINPANNAPHLAPSGTGIVLRTIATGVERTVPVPANARIDGVSFSPDGKRLSFTNTRENRVDVHIADTATGRTRLVDGALNGVARRVRMARRQLRADLQFRPGRPRTGARRAERAIRAEHSGKPWEAGTGPDVSGPAHQRARREPVRVLLQQPDLARRRGHGTPDADRQAGHDRRVVVCQTASTCSFARSSGRSRGCSSSRVPAGHRDLDPQR